MRTTLQQAERILVPQGERFSAYAEAASEEFDVDFPSFGRRRELNYEGREFVQANEAEIPQLVADGVADVGIVGLDICTEGTERIAYRSFGSPFAYFDLLASVVDVDGIRESLSRGTELMANTRYPKLLVASARRRGVRILPTELDMPLIADIVSAPEGVAVDGLQTIMRLRELRPAVVWRQRADR